MKTKVETAQLKIQFFKKVNGNKHLHSTSIRLEFIHT